MSTKKQKVRNGKNYNELRARMVKRGFTQEMLAEAIGLSAQSISAKMNGHSEFSLDDIVRIGRVLGFSQEDYYIVFIKPTEIALDEAGANQGKTKGKN